MELKARRLGKPSSIGVVKASSLGEENSEDKLMVSHIEVKALDSNPSLTKTIATKEPKEHLGAMYVKRGFRQIKFRLFIHMKLELF